MTLSVKITKEDKAQILQKENSQPTGLRRNIEFPKYYPVASGLFIDEQNRIYVRTFEKDDKGGLYHDVFDSEGRYISRFSINENEKVVVINNNKIYCIIKESEEGIPLVKRYRIEWKLLTFMMIQKSSLAKMRLQKTSVHLFKELLFLTILWSLSVRLG